MAAIIAILACTYFAGVFAAFGGLNARESGEISTRTMITVSCFSWLAFGYLACGGRVESETPASPSGTIKLTGSRPASGYSPWET